MSTAKETVQRLMGLSEQLESIVSKENEVLARKIHERLPPNPDSAL